MGLGKAIKGIADVVVGGVSEIKKNPNLEAQQDINKLEVTHRTIFVAGWRPFLGWVCGFAFFYNYVIRDLITWLMAIWYPETLPPPALQLEEITSILLGMLGLATIRTYEKVKGKTK